MIYRSMWVSYLQPGIDIAGICTRRTQPLHHASDGHAITTMALFAHQHMLYGYAESTHSLDTHTLMAATLGDVLMRIPTSRGMQVSIDLPDIYHDGMPGDGPHWRAPGYTPERRVGSLARLKPAMYCSYVYYHFLRQEEQPHGFNKYYIIGAHENMIFSYQEWPATIDTPKPQGSMSTDLTPNNWQELMHQHFELWTDQPSDSHEWIRLPLIWEK